MRLIHACAGAGVLLSGTALAQPGRYLAEEVPVYVHTYGTGVRSPTALNSSGVMALWQDREQWLHYVNGLATIEFISGAFTWSPGSLTLFPQFPRPHGALAYDINDGGMVVGLAATPAFPTGQAAVFSASQLPTLIPTFNKPSTALAVNNSGAAVGCYVYSGSPPVYRAFSYTPTGGTVDLGTLGGPGSIARDINDSGTIVGQSQDADGVLRAFIIPAGGVMTDLNDLLPDSPQFLQDVVKISPAGRLAVIAPGHCYTVVPSDPRSFVELLRFPPDGVQYEPTVTSLNDSGLAVGFQKRGSGAAAIFVATKWDSAGNPIALYGRTMKRPINPFEKAVDINQSGQIAVLTVAKGLNLIHRLTPLCPADVNADGFVDGIDYDQFMAAFETGAISADFNEDGFVDGIDYDQFNNGFETGC